MNGRSLRPAWPAAADLPDWAEDLEKAEPESGRIRGYLYDADGHDREISLDSGLPELSPRQLLWVDVQGQLEDNLETLGARLNLPDSIRSVIRSRAARAHLTKADGYVHLGIPALRFSSAEDWKPVWARFIWSDQVLITVHAQEVDALAHFRDQDRGETQIGALTGGVLCAALLDWHLASYFKAVEALERAVDRFDEHVLMRSARQDLIEDLVRIDGGPPGCDACSRPSARYFTG